MNLRHVSRVKCFESEEVGALATLILIWRIEFTRFHTSRHGCHGSHPNHDHRHQQGHLRCDLSATLRVGVCAAVRLLGAAAQRNRVSASVIRVDTSYRDGAQQLWRTSLLSLELHHAMSRAMSSGARQ